MPYKDGIIYVDTTTNPDTGVSIADIRKAVPVTLTRTVSGVTGRRSSCDLGVIAVAQVGDSVPDDAGGTAWTVSSRIDINPMAKHKPVRHSKLSPLTDTEFKNVSYGLSAGSVFNASDKNPNNAWTYLRPRGKQSNIFEPYRDTDFNNYDHLACAPFAFDVSGNLAGGVGLAFYIDSMSKEVYIGKRWNEETAIRFLDLLDVSEKYLCVAIHDLNPEHTGSCVVIWNEPISTIIGQYVSVLNIFAQERTDFGKTYPAVSLLNDRTRAGDTFRFIVGMRNNNDGQSGNQVYKVLDISSGSSIDLTSLALLPGIDRKDIILRPFDTIANLEFSLDRAEYVDFDDKGIVTRNNMQWKKYLLTMRVYGEFVTPSGSWAAGDDSVDVRLRADAGYVNPIDNGSSLIGQDNVWSKAINIPLANHTYNVEVANLVKIPIYIYKDASASVQVLAKVRHTNETKDADNTLIVSA